tara:strand:+ start:21 stop:209 length:189 start_codon:yes stop_codon:yes gene_type:complete
MLSYKFYKVKSIQEYIKKREKKENIKNLFFQKIDKDLSRDEKLDILIKQLEKQGFKINNKKR